MQPGRPGPADDLENLLHQLELVRDERVILHEVVRVAEGLQRHTYARERQLVLEDVALGRIELLEWRDDLRPLGQQPRLDDLVHVGARQRQPGGETSLNLREVVRLRGLHLAEDLVDVLLRRDDDPGGGAADGAQVLRDGLQVEHQLAVLADELPDLVDQENQAVLRAPGIQVLLHPLAEVLDAQREVRFGGVHPSFGGFLALPGGLREGVDDLVAVEGVGVAFLRPLLPGLLAVGRLEGLKFALVGQIPLHVGDMGVIPAVALHLVQDLQEYQQQRLTARPVVGLAVDVEQDHVRVGRHRTLDVGQKHAVFDL